MKKIKKKYDIEVPLPLPEKTLFPLNEEVQETLEIPDSMPKVPIITGTGGELTVENLREYLMDIFFNKTPEQEQASHDKWLKWMEENNGPVKDLGGGAYQIGPEGPVTGIGGVEFFHRCLKEEASAFIDKTDNE